MTRRYFSEKSSYSFNKSGELIRSENGKELNWGRAFYVSKEELSKALKNFQIPAKKGYEIKKHIGDAFLRALEEVEMDLKEKEGRFVTLIEEGDEVMGTYYKLRYSGGISRIESINLNVEEITDETGEIKLSLV